MTATVHQLPDPPELAWDHRWDNPPPNLPRPHRCRLWDSGTVLHRSHDMVGRDVQVSVGAAPGAVVVDLSGPARYDTATLTGRAAVSDLVASLTAALGAGRPCEGCGADAGVECFPGCLSTEEG